MAEMKTKMYILIPEDVPLGHAINSAAHASLACYLAYKDDSDMKWWLDESYRKVTVKVTRAQFEQARACPDRVVITESALHGIETAMAFKPRPAWPPCFQFYRLYV